MANRYWVGGTGNWSDNTNHWSDASGGSPGASVPTSSDNVFFDDKSFTATGQIVTGDVAAVCLNMDWTGAKFSPTLAGAQTLDIYGNMTWIPTMSVTRTTSPIRFYPSGACAINWAGVTCAGGSVQLNNAQTYTLSGNIVLLANQIQLWAGTLNTAGYDIYCPTFKPRGTNARTLTLGDSVITCTISWDFSEIANLTFNENSSTIKVTGTGAAFIGGNETFNNVELNNSMTVSGNNTFADLKLQDGVTITLTNGSTQTVTTMSGADNTIVSSTAGSAATISCSGGVIRLFSCSLKDITMSGGARFELYDSVSVSGNTGQTYLTRNPYVGGRKNRMNRTN